LSEDQIRVLELNARRVWLNYVVLADILTIEMHRAAGGEVEGDAERLEQCVQRAEEIREIIEALQISPERARDWTLLERAGALAGG